MIKCGKGVAHADAVTYATGTNANIVMSTTTNTFLDLQYNKIAIEICLQTDILHYCKGKHRMRSLCSR